MSRSVKIGLMTDNGTWKVLASFSSYDAADEALEKYENRYPNAWVDILDGALNLIE